MTHLRAVSHTVNYKMTNNVSALTDFTAYCTASIAIAIRQKFLQRGSYANLPSSATRSDIKLMVINKTCFLDKLSNLFIGNQCNDKDRDIVHNSDKTIVLFDSDREDLSLSLLYDFDTDIKSKKYRDRKDLKTIYSQVTAMVVDNAPIDQVRIAAIDTELEESNYIWDDCIDHTDWEQILDSELVIVNGMRNYWKVG